MWVQLKNKVIINLSEIAFIKKDNMGTFCIHFPSGFYLQITEGEYLNISLLLCCKRDFYDLSEK